MTEPTKRMSSTSKYPSFIIYYMRKPLIKRPVALLIGNDWSQTLIAFKNRENFVKDSGIVSVEQSNRDTESKRDLSQIKYSDNLLTVTVKQNSFVFIYGEKGDGIKVGSESKVQIMGTIVILVDGQLKQLDSGRHTIECLSKNTKIIICGQNKVLLFGDRNDYRIDNESYFERNTSEESVITPLKHKDHQQMEMTPEVIRERSSGPVFDFEDYTRNIVSNFSNKWTSTPLSQSEFQQDLSTMGLNLDWSSIKTPSPPTKTSPTSAANIPKLKPRERKYTFRKDMTDLHKLVLEKSVHDKSQSRLIDQTVGPPMPTMPTMPTMPADNPFQKNSETNRLKSLIESSLPMKTTQQKEQLKTITTNIPSPKDQPFESVLGSSQMKSSQQSIASMSSLTQKESIFTLQKTKTPYFIIYYNKLKLLDNNVRERQSIAILFGSNWFQLGIDLKDRDKYITNYRNIFVELFNKSDQKMVNDFNSVNISNNSITIYLEGEAWLTIYGERGEGIRLSNPTHTKFKGNLIICRNGIKYPKNGKKFVIRVTFDGLSVVIGDNNEILLIEEKKNYRVIEKIEQSDELPVEDIYLSDSNKSDLSDDEEMFVIPHSQGLGPPDMSDISGSSYQTELQMTDQTTHFTPESDQRFGTELDFSIKEDMGRDLNLENSNQNNYWFDANANDLSNDSEGIVRPHSQGSNAQDVSGISGSGFRTQMTSYKTELTPESNQRFRRTQRRQNIGETQERQTFDDESQTDWFKSQTSTPKTTTNFQQKQLKLDFLDLSPIRHPESPINISDKSLYSVSPIPQFKPSDEQMREQRQPTKKNLFFSKNVLPLTSIERQSRKSIERREDSDKIQFQSNLEYLVYYKDEKGKYEPIAVIIGQIKCQTQCPQIMKIIDKQKRSSILIVLYSSKDLKDNWNSVRFSREQSTLQTQDGSKLCIYDEKCDGFMITDGSKIQTKTGTFKLSPERGLIQLLDENMFFEELGEMETNGKYYHFVFSDRKLICFKPNE